MSILTQRMSAEELIKLPRGRARYELVRGELQTMSPSGSKHGAVSARLAQLLGNFVEAHQLGIVFGSETGFLVERNPDTVLAPDVSFIRNERIPQSGLPDGYWSGPPDLAVEVVSPGDSKPKVADKVERWLAAGADEVWAVNPLTQAVEIYMKGDSRRALKADDMLSGGDLLPGFEIQVADLFWRR